MKAFQLDGILIAGSKRYDYLVFQKRLMVVLASLHKDNIPALIKWLEGVHDEWKRGKG